MSFMFSYKDDTYTCIYNRKNKKSYVYKSLANDINYIPILFPLVQAVQGNKLYYYISPELMSQFYNAAKDSDDPEAQKNLKIMMDALGGSVDEMDNPYIAVITCK